MATAAGTFALVVGIADYDAGEKWQLYAPVADAARAVVWLLRRNVPPNQILLFLSPTPPSVVELLASVTEGELPAGADRVVAAVADEANVTNAIRRTLKAAPGEVLVVFWAGHGMVDEAREQRLFFKDATDDDRRNLNVQVMLASMRSSFYAGFPTQIFCIDACASRFDERTSAMTMPPFGLARGKDVNGRIQIVLTAATRGQTALESRRQRKGVFTRELLAQLEAENGAAWPPDMRAVMARVEKSFNELAPQLPSAQLPALWTYKDEGGTLRWSPPADAAARPPRPGPEVTRRVDRVEQARAFRGFFRDGIMQFRHRPHAVILFGDKGEAHHSLVERVVSDCVQKLAQQALGTPAKPPLLKLPWPARGAELEEQKDELREMLLATGTENPEVAERSCGALLGNPALQGHRLVVYHHYWTVADWSDVDTGLLRWYLDSYWNALPADDRTPHVLIFMKIVCGQEMTRTTFGSLRRLSLTPKGQMRSALESIERAGDVGCRRIVLDELQPVPFAALEAWFYEEAVDKWLSEREANAAAERIFAGPDGQPRKCLPMADIEEALGELIEPKTEQRAS